MHDPNERVEVCMYPRMCDQIFPTNVRDRLCRRRVQCCTNVLADSRERARGNLVYCSCTLVTLALCVLLQGRMGKSRDIRSRLGSSAS